MAATKNTKPFYNTEIPDDWEVAELGEICNKFLNGGTPSTQIEEYWEGNIPWVTGADIIEQRIPEVRRYISDKAIKESSTNVIPKGNLLLVTRTGVGKLTVTPFDVAISQDLTGLLLKEKVIETLFAFYFFDGNERLLKQLNQGTSISGITRNVLEALKIPLPPLPEQKAIAQVLSTADAAIHTTEKLIAQKELRKKWLMQQLLTGKKRLKGFDGEWKEVHIRDVAKEVSIRNKSDKQLTVLSCTKYDGLVPSLEYFGRKIFADDVSTYKIVPKNHFAYATNHIEEGSIGYQEMFDEALISPMYTVFKTNETVNDTFFYRLLKSHPLVYQYQNRMEGSIDRRGGLHWEAFSIIKIKLPSIEEQTAIAQVLLAADKEISLLKAKAEKLREQKKGLMQVLLTGKKRLL
ncbi:MAG: hypothetical protein B6D37_00250 [Sphingobacteriales bacterium UTBCD1]|jgi:type I restriction enzyme S subunit|nr:MAG: hypothetical protein B6D37_00250 [Sphingobacteriales bacterium UTBCD1]